MNREELLNKLAKEIAEMSDEEFEQSCKAIEKVLKSQKAKL